MKAYGAGNDDSNSVKAGPGTIYVKEGKIPKLMHKIIVVGDSESSVQQQTHTYIRGQQNEFEYDLLVLKGISYIIFSYCKPFNPLPEDNILD